MRIYDKTVILHSTKIHSNLRIRVLVDNYNFQVFFIDFYYGLDFLSVYALLLFDVRRGKNYISVIVQVMPPLPMHTE